MKRSIKNSLDSSSSGVTRKTFVLVGDSTGQIDPTRYPLNTAAVRPIGPIQQLVLKNSKFGFLVSN